MLNGIAVVATRPEPQYEAPILAALTKAFHWQRLLDDGTVESGSDIARKEGLHATTVNELLRLTPCALPRGRIHRFLPSASQHRTLH